MYSIYDLYEQPQPRRIEAIAKLIAETENEALLKQCGAKQRRARLKQNLALTIFYHRIFNRCVHLIVSSKGIYDDYDFWWLLNYYADDYNEPFFRTFLFKDGRIEKDIPEHYKTFHEEIKQAEFTGFKGFLPSLALDRLKVIHGGRKKSVYELRYYYRTKDYYDDLKEKNMI